jgi:hypothetical protein
VFQDGKSTNMTRHQQSQHVLDTAHFQQQRFSHFFFKFNQQCFIYQLKFSAFYFSNFWATQTEQCKIQPVVSKNQYQKGGSQIDKTVTYASEKWTLNKERQQAIKHF